MTELDQLIAAAFESHGSQDKVNKVYLTLLRSPLFIPTQKNAEENSEEPFQPLFAKLEDKYFVLAFDTLEKLSAWAGEEFENINYVELSGREFILGINENVFMCLNLAAPSYKEFSPDEIKHLKLIISRIDQLKGEV